MNDYGEWEVILDELNDRQVDIACLTEVNLDLTKAEVRYALMEKAKMLDKGMKLVMTSSKHSINNKPNKRGGIMTIVRGNWSGRVKKSGSDQLGRWTYAVLQGKGARTIMIITLYRVCDQRHQQGNCTIYLQQENDLRSNNRKITDPREAILTDLTTFIQQESTENCDVVIMGDCNNDISKSKRIDQFLVENNLYNAISTKHKQPLPATYDRGQKCIDIICMSKNISCNAIVNCGYLPFYDGVFSDHRGSFIDIKTNALFNRVHPDTNKGVYKRFTTKQTHKCEKYVQKLESCILDSRVDKKIRELKKQINDYLDDREGEKEELVKRCKVLSEKTSQLMIASKRKARKKPYKIGFPSSKIVREAGDDLIQARKDIRKEKAKKIVNIDRLAELETEWDKSKNMAPS